MCIRKKSSPKRTTTTTRPATQAKLQTQSSQSIQKFVLSVDKFTSKPPPTKVKKPTAPSVAEKSTNKDPTISESKSKSVKMKKSEGLQEIIKVNKSMTKQNSAGVLELTKGSKKGQPVDFQQRKKQLAAIIKERKASKVNLISGSRRSLESWSKSCVAIRQNTFSDEDIVQTPAEKSVSGVTQSSKTNVAWNLKDAEKAAIAKKTPHQIVNVISSPNASLVSALETPDPQYSQQQLIYSTFVHEGRFTRSWTFTDSRPLDGDTVSKQNALESDTGFSNLLFECTKVDCPPKKRNANVGMGEISTSNHRFINHPCKQKYPGQCASIKERPCKLCPKSCGDQKARRSKGRTSKSQSSETICIRLQKVNYPFLPEETKAKALNEKRISKNEKKLTREPDHIHAQRLDAFHSISRPEGRTNSDVCHFERLEAIADGEPAKEQLGHYRCPLACQDVLKQLNALLYEMNNISAEMDKNNRKQRV